MKIGIISDTHGSFTVWKQAYETCFQDVDLIVHCGDVLYHGPRNPLPEGYNPKALADELNSLPKDLMIAKGNCDAEVDQLVLEYPLESPYIHLITPKRKILVHHGHLWSPDSVPAKVKALYNLIISGHTHLPGIQRIGDTLYLNPGSPALPKNEDKTPTVALIDETEIRIINIFSGEIVEREKI